MKLNSRAKLKQLQATATELGASARPLDSDTAGPMRSVRAEFYSRRIDALGACSPRCACVFRCQSLCPIWLDCRWPSEPEAALWQRLRVRDYRLCRWRLPNRLGLQR